MLMPSETEMVVNSRGVPPASAIPALAASTWKSWVMLQGVCSPFMLTTPIIGLARASSSNPIARMKARWGARSRPSVVTRDRHFFMRTTSPRVPASAGDYSLRRPRLLQRGDDRRVLELRDVQLGQHSGLSIDVEHFLDRREIRRGAGIAAEIVVLEKIGVEHRYRRLQHFVDNLERLFTIGQRLFHAGSDIADVSLYQFRIL